LRIWKVEAKNLALRVGTQGVWGATSATGYLAEGSRCLFLQKGW
jgi:hypothetical protein